MDKLPSCPLSWHGPSSLAFVTDLVPALVRLSNSSSFPLLPFLSVSRLLRRHSGRLTQHRLSMCFSVYCVWFKCDAASEPPHMLPSILLEPQSFFIQLLPVDHFHWSDWCDSLVFKPTILRQSLRSLYNPLYPQKDIRQAGKQSIFVQPHRVSRYSSSETSNMVYMNPNGFDLSPNPNLDGWGISHVVVGTLYTLALWAACFYVWVNREHPMLRMRNVPLMLLAINCLHFYLYILFVIYAMNGAFSCQWEFWWMSIYLPIGIGLFQAQNQQLLLVSRQQAQLMVRDDMYKPLPSRPRGSIGGPKYYVYRLKIWWRDVNQQRKYEAYILIGMVFQVRYLTMICPVSHWQKASFLQL